MSNKRTSRVGSIVAFVLSGLFIITAIALYTNRQHVLDQLSVWSYEPSAQMNIINERVGFTPKGKFIFYATNPSLENEEGFNQSCPRQEAGSPILGCYTGNDRIYIYDLTNDELDGMEEVTAAHEMLHAAWARTSESDRQKLAAQLREAYEKVDDASIRERMEYYERTEPTELINELHSILGTEAATLSEELEKYYSQFFDRQQVLALHQKYNAIYTELYSRADELYSTMESLASSIESRSAQYEVAIGSLSADISSFNARASSGGFSTQGQFNSERAALIRRTNELETERQAINTDIQSYNTLYSEYQEIASKIEGLYNSVDSFKQIEQVPSV